MFSYPILHQILTIINITRLQTGDITVIDHMIIPLLAGQLIDDYNIIIIMDVMVEQ